LEELRALLAAAYKSHPNMEIRDAVKFIYQNEFGPGHIIKDRGDSLRRLVTELKTVYAGEEVPGEPIGNGLFRLSLRYAKGRLSPETINAMLINTANNVAGRRGRFAEKLKLLEMLPFDAMECEKYLSAYEKSGFPAVSHSEIYRFEYSPAYRIIDDCFVRFLPVFETVDRLMAGGKPVVCAIDGYCASGKTTLAELMESVYDCSVFHMDDFFLPPDMKTAERLKIPGGNVHWERFREEVALPLSKGDRVTFRRYDCGTGTLLPKKTVLPEKLSVVEGSYALHPELRGFYTLRIMLKLPYADRVERIRRRNGEELLKRFVKEWIPLENRYFEAFGVEKCCDIEID